MLMHSSRKPQQGVVLFMALIVLVALTLAALALTRSVYTSNAIAGNLAFQQAATHSASEGVEAAIAWIEANASPANAPAVTSNNPQNGYFASHSEPAGNQSWGDFLDAIPASQKASAGKDATDNTVSYVIHRMCTTAGDPALTSTGCAAPPAASSGSCRNGSSCKAGAVNMNAPIQVYYRISVMVTGPRNTKSYVQALVAL